MSPDPHTVQASGDLAALLMGGGGGTATGVALTLLVQRILERRNGGASRASLAHLEHKMDTMIDEQRKTNEHLSHLSGYLKGMTKG